MVWQALPQRGLRRWQNLPRRARRAPCADATGARRVTYIVLGA
jgi:hypothetical protein